MIVCLYKTDTLVSDARTCMSSLFTDSSSKRNRRSSHFRFSSSSCTTNALFSLRSWATVSSASLTVCCICSRYWTLSIIKMPREKKRWEVGDRGISKLGRNFKTLKFDIGSVFHQIEIFQRPIFQFIAVAWSLWMEMKAWKMERGQISVPVWKSSSPTWLWQFCENAYLLIFLLDRKHRLLRLISLIRRFGDSLAF